MRGFDEGWILISHQDLPLRTCRWPLGSPTGDNQGSDYRECFNELYLNFCHNHLKKTFFLERDGTVLRIQHRGLAGILHALPKIAAPPTSTTNRFPGKHDMGGGMQPDDPPHPRTRDQVIPQQK